MIVQESTETEIDEAADEKPQKVKANKAKAEAKEAGIILKPDGEDRAKLIKGIKFETADSRALNIRSKEFKGEQAVELVAFKVALTTSGVASRLKKHKLLFCGLTHLLVLRRQASKTAEKDPVMGGIDWRRWIVAAADEIDDSLKADADSPHQIDLNMVLVPYTTQIGSGVHLCVHNLALEWPAGTQFLVKKE